MCLQSYQSSSTVISEQTNLRFYSNHVILYTMKTTGTSLWLDQSWMFLPGKKEFLYTVTVALGWYCLCWPLVPLSLSRSMSPVSLLTDPCWILYSVVNLSIFAWYSLLSGAMLAFSPQNSWDYSCQSLLIVGWIFRVNMERCVCLCLWCEISVQYSVIGFLFLFTSFFFHFFFRLKSYCIYPGLFTYCTSPKIWKSILLPIDMS